MVAVEVKHFSEGRGSDIRGWWEDSDGSERGERLWCYDVLGCEKE